MFCPCWGRPRYTHSLGFCSTSIISASRDPVAGSCMYSHLRTKGDIVTWRRWRLIRAQAAGSTYLAVSGSDIRILSILEPGVAKPNFTPRSYTRLNSTYLQRKHTRCVLETPDLHKMHLVSSFNIQCNNCLLSVFSKLTVGAELQIIEWRIELRKKHNLAQICAKCVNKGCY